MHGVFNRIMLMFLELGVSFHVSYFLICDILAMFEISIWNLLNFMKVICVPFPSFRTSGRSRFFLIALFRLTAFTIDEEDTTISMEPIYNQNT